MDKCEAGCKVFTGGEIRHHPDCVYYPESLSKMYDDKDKRIAELEVRLTEALNCPEFVLHHINTDLQAQLEQVDIARKCLIVDKQKLQLQVERLAEAEAQLETGRQAYSDLLLNSAREISELQAQLDEHDAAWQEGIRYEQYMSLNGDDDG